MGLLFDENPLVIIPKMAEVIGLNETIIIQQVRYWVNINKKGHRNYHHGRYWCYNTSKGWQENFPFWHEKSIARMFKKIEEGIVPNIPGCTETFKILIVGNYNRSKIDRTKWHTIDEEALDRLESLAEAHFKAKEAEEQAARIAAAEAEFEAPEEPQKPSKNEATKDTSGLPFQPKVTSISTQSSHHFNSKLTPIPETNTETSPETINNNLAKDNIVDSTVKGFRISKTDELLDQLLAKTSHIGCIRIFNEVLEVYDAARQKQGADVAEKIAAAAAKIESAKNKDPAFAHFFEVRNTILRVNQRMFKKHKKVLSQFDNRAAEAMQKLIDVEIDPKLYTEWYLGLDRINFNSWAYFTAGKLLDQYDKERGHRDNVSSNKPQTAADMLKSIGR